MAGWPMTKTTQPGSPEEWLDHARSDLAYARLGERDPEVLPNQAAFHAQQAAEKAIKAAMIHHNIAFPFTHDLEGLIKRWTDAGHPWPAELADVDTLSPYAAETRYPGYFYEVSAAEVRAAIEMAEKIVAWAGHIVHPPPAAGESKQ